MVTEVYSHIPDEDRKSNAQLFQETFYEKKEEQPAATTTVQPTPAEPVAQAPVVEQVPTPAPAPVPAGTVQCRCSDGTGTFTKAEYDYFVATWSYTGQVEEMISHHSEGELHTLYNNTH